MTRRTLVIVDDSETTRELVESILTRRGWRVIALDSPFTLSGVLNAERPDVVLMDVEMPALHGDKVVEIMNRAHHHMHRCPLVLYSGLPETQLAALAHRAGAAGYIRKDVAATELVVRIEQILSGIASG